MKKLAPLILVFFLVASAISWAATPTDTATVSWIPPTTNTDGSELTDLAGYIVYHGTAPGVYYDSVDVGNVTSYQWTGLADNTKHYFAVTAYDVVSMESAHSNEVNRVVNFTVTNPPSGVVVGP